MARTLLKSAPQIKKSPVRSVPLRTSMVATSQDPARIAEDVRARSPAIVVAAREDWSDDLVTTTRIGITQCADWPLRYYIRNNAFVSTAG